MAAVKEDFDLCLVNDSLGVSSINLGVVDDSSVPLIYPGKWFEDNKSKPKLAFQEVETAKLFHMYSSMIDTQNWTDSIVVSFIIQTIDENADLFNETLAEDWTANGHKIGGPNDVISPLSLLSLDKTTHTEEYTATLDSTKQERLHHLYSLITIYRKSIALGKDPTYGAAISKQLDNHITSTPFLVNSKIFSRYHALVKESSLTKGYCMLIAAIDMFFFHFPLNKLSPLRMATLPSRYKGCTILVSLGVLASSSGLSVQQLAKTITTDALGKEFKQIGKRNELTDDLSSYFPYQIDMSLVTKSPYSASSNPTLHLWIHTIGCCLGLARSKKARLVKGAKDVENTMTSAVVVAYFLGYGGDFRQQFAITKEEADEAIARQKRLMEEANQSSSDEESDVEPEAGTSTQEQSVPTRTKRSRMPSENDSKTGLINSILTSLMTFPEMTPDQQTYVKGRARSCSTCAKGTIGAYFYNTYFNTM